MQFYCQNMIQLKKDTKICLHVEKWSRYSTYAQRVLARNHLGLTSVKSRKCRRFSDGEIKKTVGVDTVKCLRKIEHSVFGDLL